MTINRTEPPDSDSLNRQSDLYFNLSQTASETAQKASAARSSLAANALSAIAEKAQKAAQSVLLKGDVVSARPTDLIREIPDPTGALPLMDSLASDHYRRQIDIARGHLPPHEPTSTMRIVRYLRTMAHAVENTAVILGPHTEKGALRAAQWFAEIAPRRDALRCAARSYSMLSAPDLCSAVSPNGDCCSAHRARRNLMESARTYVSHIAKSGLEIPLRIAAEIPGHQPSYERLAVDPNAQHVMSKITGRESELLPIYDSSTEALYLFPSPLTAREFYNVRSDLHFYAGLLTLDWLPLEESIGTDDPAPAVKWDQDRSTLYPEAESHLKKSLSKISRSVSNTTAMYSDRTQ